MYYIALFFSHFKGHSGGVQEDDMAPSAPPLDHMDHVYGYESTSFDARNVPLDFTSIAAFLKRNFQLYA